MSVRDLPVLRSEVLRSLSELSRDRFFVEFNAYFSCHLLQSAVALHGLGTSKVKPFWSLLEHPDLNQLRVTCNWNFSMLW